MVMRIPAKICVLATRIRPVVSGTERMASSFFSFFVLAAGWMPHTKTHVFARQYDSR